MLANRGRPGRPSLPRWVFVVGTGGLARPPNGWRWPLCLGVPVAVMVDGGFVVVGGGVGKPRTAGPAVPTAVGFCGRDGRPRPSAERVAAAVLSGRCPVAVRVAWKGPWWSGAVVGKSRTAGPAVPTAVDFCGRDGRPRPSAVGVAAGPVCGVSGRCGGDGGALGVRSVVGQLRTAVPTGRAYGLC